MLVEGWHGWDLVWFCLCGRCCTLYVKGLAIVNTQHWCSSMAMGLELVRQLLVLEYVRCLKWARSVSCISTRARFSARRVEDLLNP